jgi:lipopolysaccharide/colanic/teichoic acid biosynthesis glycosyltransferase
MKRTLDFLVALLGLIFLVPLFFIIGFFVKFDGKGPVLFMQKRVGKDGKLFILYKFRSMRINESSEEGSFEPGNTYRVTSIGKFLRRTKLDEISQLFNVIKGDMSLVGPRPEVPKWIAAYPERWAKVLVVKPGITDNASILFRNEELLLAGSDDPENTYREIILPKKLDLYEDYVVNKSFCGDIKLIFKTLYSVLLK